VPIEHVNKHTEDAVRFAFGILQNRNVELPLGTLEWIEKELASKEEEEKGEATHQWKRNVVDDPEAPEYYSQSAICIRIMQINS
jgi:hypothetical protein